MNTKNPIKAYRSATHTAAKTRQVVMLYDGAIRFLQQGKEAIETKSVEQRYNKLAKASEIIAGLQSCLDFEGGGDAAQVLHDFYASIDFRILALHRSNDAKACDAIIAELKQMRDVWDKIDRGDNATQAKSPEQPVPQAVTVSA